MGATTLAVGTGQLPNGSAFELSVSEAEVASIPVWDLGAARGAQGDMWLDYPHELGFQGIGGENTKVDRATPEGRASVEALQEHNVREQIEAGIAAIMDKGEQYGFGRWRVWRILTELLQNATAHGALSESVKYAGLVRLAWEFGTSQDGGALTVAVSNPIPRLFNPAKYCNISFEEFDVIAEAGGSGHVAVGVLVGYLAEGHKLHYLWDLADGSRIVCRLGASASGDSEVELDGLILNPATVEVSKYSVDNSELPYSLEGFLRDVEAGLTTEAVTVAAVFARGEPNLSGEADPHTA
jgi:hypothetical protein